MPGADAVNLQRHPHCQLGEGRLSVHGRVRAGRERKQCLQTQAERRPQEPFLKDWVGREVVR